MRIKLSLALAALLFTVAGPAIAQTGSGGASPTLYNTGEAAAPMIAGKNAPSYVSPSSSSAPQPYSFGSSGAQDTGYGMMTADQANAARALRDQQAAKAQQEYLAMMQNGGVPPGTESLYQNTTEGLNNILAPEEEQVPKKRRVVYNKRNNDSAVPIPPRLFNPDQR